MIPDFFALPLDEKNEYLCRLESGQIPPQFSPVNLAPYQTHPYTRCPKCKMLRRSVFRLMFQGVMLRRQLQAPSGLRIFSMYLCNFMIGQCTECHQIFFSKPPEPVPLSDIHDPSVKQAGVPTIQRLADSIKSMSDRIAELEAIYERESSYRREQNERSS